VNELPTLRQAEDAAANALADLMCQGIESHTNDPRTTFEDAVRETARELLRGPLDEDHSRRWGGYCMRAPTDPVLGTIGHVGAALVELSYTVRDPARALAEAGRLFHKLDRYSPDPVRGRLR
jgi:hypothetical protein